MSGIRAQLDRLRVQAGASGIGPVVDASSSRLRDDLRRMLGLRGRLLRATLPAPANAGDRELPGTEIEPGLMLVETVSNWPQAPQQIDTAAIGGAIGGALGGAIIDAGRFRFFDTETTGLAGGTGTRAFQIGVADFTGRGFRIRQLTITKLGAEPAMLRAFGEWLSPDAVLVSYNGRSYDAPLLATRFRLARLPSPLPGLIHLDLLHPTRRRYRGVWENCRLATVERELLGVVREDDLPGSEAPRAWLDYLRGGDAVNLRRVAAHNAQDLRSLALLLMRLTG